jgi:flagellar basal-body rod protein FlgB
MSKLFDRTTEGIAKSLDMRLLRHNITSANIANAETPGYTAKKVDFEDELTRALQMEGITGVETSSPDQYPVVEGAVKKVQPDIYDNPDINVTNDKNTVDLEKEMATLTENSLIYKAAIELMRKKMASLKYAVTEGGK